MALVPELRSAVLGLIRRGPRTVLWTRPGYGLGNLLYLLLHARARREQGEDVVVLDSPGLQRWLPMLGPEAAALVVRRSEVRATDRRDVHGPFRLGEDWSVADLDGFVTDILVGTALLDPDGATPLGPDDVVLVVRRGDYWSVPEYRARYAIDVLAYLDAALALQERVGGPAPRLHVVSDGPRWCRAHLGHLAADGRTVTYAEPGQTGRDHLATLAGARRVVSTNTTFGYWGGHLAGRLAGRPELVVVPRFHARGAAKRDDARQIEPRWSVVEDIPGGWVEPPPDRWDAGDHAPTADHP